MGEFRMPSLGADMEDGTLVEWKVKVGDAVKKGDLIAVVETVKGIIDVETFEAGRVTQLLVEPGTKVPVGTVLAILDGKPAELPLSPAPPGPPAPKIPATVAAPVSPPQAAPAPVGRRPVSPAARRRAQELGLALDSLSGSGADGAVTVADVERAAREQPPSPPGPAGMREAIAQSMSRSKREIPHYYLGTQLCLSRALAWLERQNQSRAISERLLPASVLLRATALALREVRVLNGIYAGGRFQPAEHVHLGVAIRLRGGGLIAPAIEAAEELPVAALMQRLGDLVLRARQGGVRTAELASPTVTVTHLGDLGAELVFPVIHPPQVAMVGFGRIVDRPWAEAGRLIAAPVVFASVAGDHRVSDGFEGAAFLRSLDHLLQQPEAL